MLNIFQLKNNRLYHINNTKEKFNLLSQSIWIDLINPTEQEKNDIFIELGQNLSTHITLEDIEASARFFEDKDGLHIHSFFFYADSKDHIGNTTVAFTIRNGILFSIRNKELPAFRLYYSRTYTQTLTDDSNAYKILLDLLETKIEQLADAIENVYSDIKSLSIIIMEGKQNNQYDNTFTTLALLEDIGWKVQLCLMDTQRALNFLIRKTKLSVFQLKQAHEILRDIDSLLPHNESLFQKVNFLMQASMGLITIEQNRIIKIFSVVSVIFLPPTLVASSYGMNFEFMPELKWTFGYPSAITLMILAGLAPYLYFKRKKWL